MQIQEREEHYISTEKHKSWKHRNQSDIDGENDRGEEENLFPFKQRMFVIEQGKKKII